MWVSARSRDEILYRVWILSPVAGKNLQSVKLFFSRADGGIEFAPHDEPGGGRGIGDEVDDGLVRCQWPPAPVEVMRDNSLCSILSICWSRALSEAVVTLSSTSSNLLGRLERAGVGRFVALVHRAV